MLKQPVSMIRGTTQKINLTITDDSGTPAEIEPTDILMFGVKDSYKDSEYVLIKILSSSSEENVYECYIEPGDTLGLNCDKPYFYDIGLQRGSDFYNIIPASEFNILPNITSYTEVYS